MLRTRLLGGPIATAHHLSKLLLLSAVLSLLLVGLATGGGRVQAGSDDDLSLDGEVTVVEEGTMESTVAAGDEGDLETNEGADFEEGTPPATMPPADPPAMAPPANPPAQVMPRADEFPANPCFSLFDFDLVPGPNGTWTLLGFIRGGPYDGASVIGTLSQPGQSYVGQVSVIRNGQTIATITFYARPEGGVNYGGRLTVTQSVRTAVNAGQLTGSQIFLGFWRSSEGGTGRIYGLC